MSVVTTIFHTVKIARALIEKYHLSYPVQFEYRDDDDVPLTKCKLLNKDGRATRTSILKPAGYQPVGIGTLLLTDNLGIKMSVRKIEKFVQKPN